MSSSRFEIIQGMKYRRKVRAIIRNDEGEYLLIRPHFYEEGTWSFIGGGVEENEDAFKAIHREIYEETGISRLNSLLKSDERRSFLFKPETRLKRGLDHEGQIADVFLVTIATGTPVNIQKEEIAEYRWAKLDEMKNLVKVPEQYALFEEVLKELGPRTKAA